MNHDRRQRRGRQAMDAAGILPGYRGCAVHDFWESYLDYDCGHAFCNGHLLRELIFLWQEQDQKWAKSMIDHLLGIKDAVATARTAGLAALPDADLDRSSNAMSASSKRARAVVGLSLVCYAAIYALVGLIILFCLRGLIVIFGDRKEPSSA
jgi:hypothetical protein